MSLEAERGKGEVVYGLMEGGMSTLNDGRTDLADNRASHAIEDRMTTPSHRDGQGRYHARSDCHWITISR